MCQKAILLKINDIVKTRIRNDIFYEVKKTKISLENNGRNLIYIWRQQETEWEKLRNKQQKCEESKQRIGDLNRKTTKIVESNHRNWDRSTNEVCFQLYDLFKKTVDNLEDRTAAFAEY